MQELLDWMEYIEDDRQQRKSSSYIKGHSCYCVVYPTLANADDWVEMVLFAENYQDYLRKYIELKTEYHLMIQ